MDMKDIKQTLNRALDQHAGDDLYRARLAFAGWSDEKLDQPWSGNGESARQVLAGYEDHRRRIDAARAFVNSL